MNSVREYREFVHTLQRFEQRDFAAELNALRAGSDDARRRIGEGFLREVLTIADEVYGPHPKFDQLDLYQEANAALWETMSDFAGESLDAFREHLRCAIVARFAEYERELWSRKPPG
jgi:hypothetical protein